MNFKLALFFIPCALTGLYFLGSLEVKNKGPSIYELTLKTQKTDSIVDKISPTQKVKNSHKVLNKMWKNFDVKLQKLPRKLLLSNINSYNAEHRFLLNRSMKEVYPLTPVQQLSPSMRFVISTKTNTEISHLTDGQLIEFQKDRELWRELSRLSNDLRQVALK